MRLYKYFHPDRIDVLEGGLLRFTQPACFNDPFEVLPAVREVIPIDQAAALLRDIISSNEAELRTRYHQELASNNQVAQILRLLPPEFQSQASYENAMTTVLEELPDFLNVFLPLVSEHLRTMFPAQMQDRLNRMFGILCLTEQPDNLLMWAHYGDCHRGFVMEFDATHSFFDQRKAPRDLIRHLQKVTYSQTRPQLTLYDPSVDPVEFAQRIAVSFFLTKSRAWEYEQEWRMIVPIAEADDPYSALHLYSFPPELVKGIILGCRMPQGHRRRFSELIEHDERYRHVSLHEAVVDRDSFAVNVVPVES